MLRATWLAAGIMEQFTTATASKSDGEPGICGGAVEPIPFTATPAPWRCLLIHDHVTSRQDRQALARCSQETLAAVLTALDGKMQRLSLSRAWRLHQQAERRAPGWWPPGLMAPGELVNVRPWPQVSDDVTPADAHKVTNAPSEARAVADEHVQYAHLGPVRTPLSLRRRT
jgi:hypothetical protein